VQATSRREAARAGRCAPASAFQLPGEPRRRRCETSLATCGLTRAPRPASRAAGAARAGASRAAARAPGAAASAAGAGAAAVRRPVPPPAGKSVSSSGQVPVLVCTTAACLVTTSPPLACPAFA